MSDNVTPIALVDPAHQAWCDEGANILHEIADRVASGQIKELVVVYRDGENNYFASFGHFEDRWRLLGALEYAKNAVHDN